MRNINFKTHSKSHCIVTRNALSGTFLVVIGQKLRVSNKTHLLNDFKNNYLTIQNNKGMLLILLTN